MGPCIKVAVVHGLATRSPIAVSRGTIGVQGCEVALPPRSHMNVKLALHDIEPRVDNLHNDLGEIVPPSPLPIQELYLKTLPTLTVAGTTRNCVHKVLGVAVVFCSQNHVIAEHGVMRACVRIRVGRSPITTRRRCVGTVGRTAGRYITVFP